MILNILEGFDLASIGENTAAYVHLTVEATKLAFAERDRYLTDPEFSDIPLDRLLSKEYAAELHDRIQFDRAEPVAPAYAAAGDTTCSRRRPGRECRLDHPKSSPRVRLGLRGWR